MQRSFCLVVVLLILVGVHSLDALSQSKKGSPISKSSKTISTAIAPKVIQDTSALRVAESNQNLTLLISGGVVAVLLVGMTMLVVLQHHYRQRMSNRLQGTISELSQYKERFKDVIDREARMTELDQQIQEMTQSYAKNKEVYDRLRNETAILEETVELHEAGIYKPHFPFDSSEMYKAKLEENYEKQRTLVKEGRAIRVDKSWTVSGSKSEGDKMVRKYSKLMLRAFNGECESFVARVRWNNVKTMEERIRKAFEAVNQSGTSLGIEITNDYVSEKLAELWLTHEYEQKKYEEKEEQRRIQEEMREEEKAQREIEQAKKEAEDEENRYQKALENARSEMENVKGAELTALSEKIKELEQRLREAQEMKQRVISRAQMTKSGHVYVISNIGSFGANVFKIGMTRRLDPMDRVKELGDASVPFAFDVHAMVYSENAPELEYKLHQQFDKRRLNLVNERKEFFEVTLPELAAFAQENNTHIEFTQVAEAREYRESVALREAQSKVGQSHSPQLESFPQVLGQM